MGLRFTSRPEAGHAGTADQIATAVQEGNVVMTQTPVKQAGGCELAAGRERLRPRGRSTTERRRS